MAELPLHPGFAASWARLREVAASIPLLVNRQSVRIAFNRAAAACGSSAAVIALTTTTRCAPASSTSGRRCSSMPPIANHGLSRGQLGCGPHECKARGGASRLRRRRPARPDAEIVHLLGHRCDHLVTVVGGAADQRSRPDDVPRDRQRQVVLTQMQHIGGGRRCDIGPVVDRQQRVVPSRRVGEHLERGELVAGLQRSELLLAGRALVAQLDDVHPARQCRLGEFGQITTLAAGVGAHVQGRRSQPIAGLVHTARVMWDVDTGVPGTGD